MSQSNWPTSDDVKAIIERGDVPEAMRARGELIVKKKGIESQLAEDRNDMLAERSDNMKSGMSPREAQFKATNSGDHDWRSRATTAATCIDRDLARIKAFMAVKGTSENSGKFDAVVFSGTPAEVAAAIMEDGRKIATMAPYQGAIVVCFWRS